MTDLYPNIGGPQSASNPASATPPSEETPEAFSVPTLPNTPIVASPLDPNPNPPLITNTQQGSQQIPPGFIRIEAARPTTPNTTDITDLVERIPRAIVSEVPRVRTYADDIKTALSRDAMSLSRIAMEEQKRRDRLAANQAVSARNPKNVALVFLSLILVLAAGASIWYFTTQVNKDPVETVLVDGQTGIIPFDSSFNLEFENSTRASISADIARVSTQTFTAGTIALINYVDAAKQNVTTSVLLSRIGGRAPESLLRALDNRYALGIYSETVNAPFFILKTDSYQAAYAGMLAWEPRLAIDMEGVLYRRAVIAGDTSAPAGQYVDRIVGNRDMRAYVDQTNRTLFYYGFITNELIIIAPNEPTILAIINKIQRNAARR